MVLSTANGGLDSDDDEEEMLDEMEPVFWRILPAGNKLKHPGDPVEVPMVYFS